MIDTHLFEFPLSLILALALLVCIFIFRQYTAGGFPASRRLSLPFMLILSVLLAVEGTWSLGLFHHWTFIVIIVIALMILGITSFNDFSHKSLSAFLSHSGLFLILFGGLFGAILSLKTVWGNKKVLFAALSLAVVFALISVTRISFGTLPPALRSLWFVPHLIVYMLAYSILALAVIAGFASFFSAKIPDSLSTKLLSTASSLLLIGMLGRSHLASDIGRNTRS